MHMIGVMLDMVQTTAELELYNIIKKLKTYKNDIYGLKPAEMADFIQLKSSFIREGIVLNDDVLSKDTSEIVAFVNAQRANNDKTCAPDTCADPIENALSADIRAMDKDRVQIRNFLLNDDMAVRMTRSGRIFSVQWNNKMTVCKINVPSTWDININQALLLDIYEKDCKSPSMQVTETETTIKTKFSSFVYDLLSRHNDYSIIKRIVELEFEDSEEAYIKGIDKRKLHRLKNRGFSVPVAALLISFADHVLNKACSSASIMSLLGYRKRLTKEFNNIVSSATT